MKNIKNIILVGGNIYKQDIPFKNFLASVKEYKFNLEVCTDKRRSLLDNKKEKFNKYIKKKKIPLKIFENYESFSKYIINKFNPDDTVIFLLNCKWLIKKDLLNKFKNIFNYHNASLDKFRGSAAQSWMLMMNENTNVISIHRINKYFDDGDVLLTKKIFIDKAKNLNQIYKYIDKYEADFFSKFFFLFINKKIKKIENKNKVNFFYPKIRQNIDSFVNWNWSSQDIISFSNAFDDPYKGITAIIGNKKIYLKKAKLINKKKFHPYQYGIIFWKSLKKIYVATRGGAISFEYNSSKNDVKLGQKFENLFYQKALDLQEIEKKDYLLKKNNRIIQENFFGKTINLVKIKNQYNLDMNEYFRNKLFYKHFEFDVSKIYGNINSYVNRINKLSETGLNKFWGIILKNENKCVGTICVRNFDRYRNSIEIGYGLNPKYQGTNLFHESLKIILNYLSNNLKVRRVYAVTSVKNYPSINALKKFKFVIEGEMRDFYKKSDNKFYNAYLMSKVFKKNKV